MPILWKEAEHMADEVLESKSSSIGKIEIRKQSNGWYGLYVAGKLKQQSADYRHIKSEYDKL